MCYCDDHRIGTCKEQTVGSLQQKMLFVKYERTLMKMRGCFRSGNMPMYEIYKREIKAIRTTLGLLGIHIGGINK